MFIFLSQHKNLLNNDNKNAGLNGIAVGPTLGQCSWPHGQELMFVGLYVQQFYLEEIKTSILLFINRFLWQLPSL